MSSAAMVGLLPTSAAAAISSIMCWSRSMSATVTPVLPPSATRAVQGRRGVVQLRISSSGQADDRGAAVWVYLDRRLAFELAEGLAARGRD